jgi:catechol 2,3-dioxygenase-like lactoylglutathione lyase family enzyme
MTTPKLNVFGLIVADIARALAFYRALGLQIPASADSEPHVDVDLGGGIRLSFDDATMVRGFMPGYQPSSGQWGSLAFECESPAAVDSCYERLTGAGHHGEMKPWDAFWGQRYAVLRDPDGNSVDLYAAIPAS